MKILIVNADDLGLDRSVNRGILRAFEKGIVTRASLLMNGAASKDALQWARSAQLPVGLHWNLTIGRPLLPPHQVPSLVDRHGCFYGMWRLWSRSRRGKIFDRHVAAELDEQWRRFLDNCGQPNHLDSHHHVHLFPVVSAYARQLANRYPAVPIRRFSRPEGWEKRFGLVEAALLYRQAQRCGMTSSADRFLGFSWMRATDKHAFLLQLLEKLPKGRTELMCHPADSAVPDRSATHYLTDRFLEYRALTDPSVCDRVRVLNIHLAK
ncbi:ChbG/HpnK family deacetylase [candidate division KSB1 bacterium]|nr:ChbG/HpnK family deacetylase [candidate division KSB1 bacterium]